MTRKKHTTRHSSSEESIENLLYYKDCKHNPQLSTTIAAPVMLKKTEAPKSDCPCPRMCCSMCCDCSIPLPQSYQNTNARPMQPIQAGPPQLMGPPMQALRHPIPAQPNIDMDSADMSMMHPARKKQSKSKFEDMMLPPFDGRRGISLTRDNIKRLINKDEDIKKILKDLIRVTMAKVDLKARKSKTPARIAPQPERRSKEREDREVDRTTDDDYLED